VILWAFCVVLGPARPSPAASAYTLGPNDKIHIQVYDNDDLTQDVTIPTNGQFEYPFIGVVQAAGKTTTDLEQDLAKRLGDGYLVNPQVRVTVTEYQSKKVHVMGAVKRPGTCVLKSDITILELITEVEGPTDVFSGQINVMRDRKGAGGKGDHEIVTINYRSLVDGQVESNIILQGNDYVIFESRLDSKENVNVTGAVREPGPHPLVKDMTIMEAIVSAKGTTQDAGDRVQVIRSRGKGEGAAGKDGSTAPELSFELNKVMANEVDFKLANGDSIIVPRNQELDYCFFVLGEVKSPKDYPWKKGITVLQAISMAGGLTDYGTTKNIEVTPNVGGRSGKSKRVNVEYEVQPGDTIAIKEGWF
jgi:polysaccharide export outer membrane protein